MGLTTSRNGANRAVICRLGERVFALPGTAVREVCTDVQLVRMPGVAAPVEGVFNLRGTLVTVVRASGESVAERTERTASTWCVVVQGRDGRVGLGVDDVIDFEVPGPEVPLLDVEAAIESIFRRGTSEHSSFPS